MATTWPFRCGARMPARPARPSSPIR
jgi:hypothetical protein